MRHSRIYALRWALPIATHSKLFRNLEPAMAYHSRSRGVDHKKSLCSKKSKKKCHVMPHSDSAAKAAKAAKQHLLLLFGSSQSQSGWSQHILGKGCTRMKATYGPHLPTTARQMSLGLRNKAPNHAGCVPSICPNHARLPAIDM